MAEYRPIKVKIWHDSWFSSLQIEEKLFWIFLLTNDYFHISGIYELPKPLISPLSGCPNALPIIEKFIKEGKMEYKEGFIFIRNYLKNQDKQINKKDNIFKGISLYLSQNSFLISLFNLQEEAPYKPLISPLPSPYVKRKVIKIESNKDIVADATENTSHKEIIEVIELFKEINPSYKQFFGNKTQRGAAGRLLKEYGSLEEIKKRIETIKKTNIMPYAPVITTPKQFEDKRAALAAFIQKK